MFRMHDMCPRPLVVSRQHISDQILCASIQAPKQSQMVEANVLAGRDRGITFQRCIGAIAAHADTVIVVTDEDHGC